MIETLKSCSFRIANLTEFKKQVLNWLEPFSIFCFLDNQQYSISPQHAECLVGVGVKEFVQGNNMNEADDFLKKKQWTFGHLSYELKNSLHHLSSDKEDKIGFPAYYFFSPQIVLEIKNDILIIHGAEPEKIFEEILQQSVNGSNGFTSSIHSQSVLSKEQYIQEIKLLQEHIHRGDCYEINFCQEIYAVDVSVNPFTVFQKLMEVSPNPFSAFYRLNDKFLLCASPERFLAKKENKIFSQPMKGTMKRMLSNKGEDEKLKDFLHHNQKERAENVMVVDLVRNDLTKICKESSVKVEELFSVYSFPQVHQMVSTISGDLKEDILFSEIIAATFPMGSMTGAPKHRVMQLIEEYEPSARGIFSGSVGYINPNGNFDFNVVIRSIMYNASKKYLSYQVGSGITFYSDPEKEWEECMLKAEAIKKVLTNE